MLLALPILLPLLAAIALLLLPQRRRLRRVIAFVGALLILGAAVAILVRVRSGGIQVLQIGSWPAPYGITLVADLFSALMVVMVGIIGVAVTGSSFSGVDPRREAFGYHALIHVLLMGVAGAFLTGDIFNLYVWFEVMLIASFVLMSLHRTRAQLHAAFTYVALNLLASAFLLTAIGLLYGQAGTLNFADLARAWPDRRTPGLDAALSMLFLTAFGIKAGLFPLFFWLPASYHTPPAAIGALLAGLLTKVGVYAMIRVFTLLFVDPAASVYTALLAMSGVTMIVGLIGALGQHDLRRILSFNLIGHIGFTTVGLALRTPASLGGSILYVLHHILVISTLFLVSGLFLRLRRTTDLRLLGGMYRSQPLVACLVMVPLFSLAGIPPLSGFVAKLAVVGPMIGRQHYVLAAVALTVSLLTVLSMARVWEEAFWKPATDRAAGSAHQPRLDAAILAPVVLLVSLTIGLSVAAGPVYDMATRAAQQLLDRNDYVRAVVGEGAPRAAR
ncbi:MAG: proton-conducting transporter membrane subunit [Acidobacteriota bacterium]